MVYRARNGKLQQEEDVVPPWRVLGVLAAILAIFTLLVAWAWYAMRAEESLVRPSGRFPERNLRPLNEEQRSLDQLFETVGVAKVMNDEQRKALERFGWVDREHGIVSIPIEDAMDLVVQEGNRHP